MTFSTADQQRIIQQESAWVDADQFAPLDLSQFPALQPLPPADKYADSFSREYGDTALSRSASSLRKFVEDPDTESLERVGKEIGDAGFREEVRDRRGELIAQQFKKACPGYIPTDANYQAVVSTLAFNALSAAEQNEDIDDQVAALIDKGYWTVPNLIACYNALNAEGLLQVPAGTARNLTTAERLRVTRMAQAGRADEAIGEFLRCSLDGEEPSMELVNDPAYRDVCDSAVWAVFEDTQCDYVPTLPREAFMRRHCAGRPVTLPLLQSAWSACQKSEQRHERGELLTSFQYPQEIVPPSLREIDALDDASVDRLYHASLREYANQFRRGPGVSA